MAPPRWMEPAAIAAASPNRAVAAAVRSTMITFCTVQDMGAVFSVTQATGSSQVSRGYLLLQRWVVDGRGGESPRTGGGSGKPERGCRDGGQGSGACWAATCAVDSSWSIACSAAVNACGTVRMDWVCRAATYPLKMVNASWLAHSNMVGGVAHPCGTASVNHCRAFAGSNGAVCPTAHTHAFQRSTRAGGNGSNCIIVFCHEVSAQSHRSRTRARSGWRGAALI